MIMPPILYFPATCELCGHWIPKHAGDCPRNGVHPSQWQLFQSINTVQPNSKTNDYSINVITISYQPIDVVDDNDSFTQACIIHHIE